MNRRRISSRSLTGTRIFVRRGKYSYFSPDPILNPKTGKVAKWHILCRVEDGELQARITLNELLGHLEKPKGPGDFCAWFSKWRSQLIHKRQLEAPRDPARKAIWEKGSKALISVFAVIENAFSEFDIAEIMPRDIAVFVDQWEGRRSAQSYKGHLSKFFEWCCRRGILATNPAREVSVAPPKKRDVYITNEQYALIYNALLVGNDEKPTRTGPMVQCYMDLLYLLYQRGTEIRLLRWDQISEDEILFKPTKTERTSGAKVRIPITKDIRTVLHRAKSIRKMRSIYIIHTEHGQPYTSHGIGSLFERACERAGIEGVTLKDIRAKAATDAKELGYAEAQIQTALAHTNGATTRSYIRSRETPKSEVLLSLPIEKK